MKNKSEQKKPFYKRTWFIVLAGLIVIGGATNLINGGSSSDPAKAALSETSEVIARTSQIIAGVSESASDNEVAQNNISTTSESVVSSEKSTNQDLPPVGEAAAVTRQAMNEFYPYIPTYTDNLDDYMVVPFDDRSVSVSGRITTTADGESYDVFCVYEKNPETGDATTHLLMVGNALFVVDDTVTEFMENCKELLGVDPVPYTELLEQLEAGQ